MRRQSFANADNAPIDDDAALFRAAFAHSPQATLIVAAHGRIHRANPAACTLLNMTADAVAGRPLWETAFSQAEAVWEALPDKGEYEEEHTLEGGTAVFCRVTLHVAPDHHLVTLQPQASDDGRSPFPPPQGRRFRALYETSPIPTYLWQWQEDDFILVDFNPAASRLARGAAEAFLGRTSAQIYPDRPDLRADLRYCFWKETAVSRETAYFTRGTQENRYIIFSYSYAPPDQVMMHAEDFTQRWQAEEALRKLSRAVEQSPVSVVITDPEGNIEYVNPHFTQVTGYTEAEALGENPNILNAGRQGEAFYKEMWETIAAGRVWRGEFLNRKKDGSLFWESASISPIIDDNGRITHYVAVKEDITTRKRLAEQAQQQERLAALGQLAAGIAHDFNNILAVLLLYTQLWQMQEEPIQDRRQIRTVLDQIRRAKDLIQQILDFSRQSVLKKQRLALTSVIKEEVKLLRRTLPSNITISFSRLPADDETPLLASVDITRLQQLLMNLGINARDAMPDGGALHFTLAPYRLAENDEPPVPSMPPGDWVQLTISDSGIGIAEEALPHIFDPFYTTKTPDKGTGLGLAQVYGIVKQHDGFIKVESEIGAGAAFTIYLPRLDGVTARDNDEETGPLASGADQCILLVEDDEYTRQALEQGLLTLGYRVVVAHNGREAMAKLRAEETAVDLILSDMVMPEMGGVELLHRLREEAYDLPVIILSGYPLTADVSHLKSQGMTDWLSKPLELKQLARTIAAHLPPHKRY
jgi:PAS domain S-box-containing protein